AVEGRRTREAIFMTYLSEVLLVTGRTNEAFTLAERALALSRERSERATEARALRLLGEIVTPAAGEREPAGGGHLHEALALAEELGARPLLGQCHLGLARLARRMGNGEARNEHMVRATTMFRELGMTFWLERAVAGSRGS